MDSMIKQYPPIGKDKGAKKPKYGKTSMFPALKKKPADNKFVSPY